MKKIIKNNIKIILLLIICAVVFTGFGVYAAYNYYAKDINFTPTNESWEVENVEEALNDLYERKDNSVIKNANIETIVTISSQNINHEYIADSDGIYLVGIANCNHGVKGSIDTTSEVMLDRVLGEENVLNARTAFIKVLKVNKNEKINISGSNESNNASAFIYKLNNININSIVDSSLISDNTSTLTYTAAKDNESVIVLGVGYGRDKTSNITYTGNYFTHERQNNEFSIGYAILEKNASVTVSSYGYYYGGAATFILK